ncbi:MAG: cadherin-like domain-containing protein [Pyrinomonadaceae bacterium]|nr:cadherin-like domain-containing protein [Pyrinomonadaceae bacterium]
MKRTKSPFYARRTFILSLLSFVAVAAVVSFSVSARKASREAALRAISNTTRAAKPGAAVNVQDKNPNVPEAATMTATLDDGVAAGNKVPPGGPINYTAIISNTAPLSVANEAGSVTYSATLDANTTISGLVQVSPVTVNDTYPNTVIGNVAINSDGVFNVLTNDYMGQNPAGTVTPFTGLSIQGGNVVLDADGTFTYNPPAGYEGADSFTYTLSNAAGSSIGTVNLTVAGMVWFINNNSAACTTVAAGCGRITNPFSTLAAFSAANGVADAPPVYNPGINDNIFIYESATAYDSAVVLRNGQKLIGQDSTSTLATLTGLTPPAGSTAFPTMNSGNATITKIITTAATTNGITLNNVGGAGTNVVNGLTVGNTTATGIFGSSFGTLTVADVSIDEPSANRSGQALSLTTGAVNATFITVESHSASPSGTTNVTLSGVTGTINLGTGALALTAGTGNSFNVTGTVPIPNTATISYAGTINNTVGSVVSVAGKTGGSVSLSGAITGSGSGANGGISLLTNTGATINFTGGIALNMSGSAPGFTATGGGTVNATQNNAAIVNTVTTSTGAALNVANTTIGASGLTFRSLFSNGATNGIIVNNTGATGSFTITGNGGTCTTSANCSGGAIQNSTGDSVVLTSTQSPSITRLNVTDSAGGAGDDGILMTNITGTATIDTSAIINVPHNGVWLDNTNTNMTAFNLTNSTISCATGQPCEPAGSIGNDGVLVAMRGTSVLTSGTISGSTFSGHRGVGVQIQTNDTGRIGSNSGGVITAPAASNSITIQSNTCTANGQAISVDTSQISNMSFQILTNTVTGISTASGGNGSATAINAFTAAGAGTGPTSHTFVGKIDGNSIGTQGVKDSGSGFGNGIRVVTQGQATQASITVNNNTVRETSIATPLNFIGQNGAAAAGTLTARFKITNNVLPLPSGTNVDVCGANVVCIDAGLFILADEGSPVCNVITGNNIFDVGTYAGTFDVYLAERAGPPAGAQLTVEGTGGSNSAYIQANNTLAGANKFLDEGANTSQVGLGACGSFPALMSSPDEVASNYTDVPASVSSIETTASKHEALVAELRTAQQVATPVSKSPVAAASGSFDMSGARRSHHPQFNRTRTIKASMADQKPLAPESGEAIGPINIGILQGGKSVTFKYAATVNFAPPPTARQANHQGSVSFTNGGPSPLLTDDTDQPGGAANPTVTLFDMLMTWNGNTSSDWNTATNWTPPAGGTAYVPGVTNPAVNDVVIPIAGVTNQPTIGAAMPDVTIFSLNFAAGTLTIDPARKLTIGAPAPGVGGDLTLNGIITGGELRFGTGSHVITVGTGSLSSTNLMRVLSGSSVTLNNNLQAGALAIDTGGTLIISNRTLSLNGSGAALAVAGGTTFTVTGSTVVFNGTAAQQAAGTTYNNLTINNTIGANVTGVTLTGSATVNGILDLLSSDLNTTSSFTLTQPPTPASTGVTDVVGTVIRSNGASALPLATALTFGNPNNRITFTAGVTPTAVTVTMEKAAPSSPNPYLSAVQRNYTITPSSVTAFTSTVRLHYLDSELNNNVEANLNLRRFDGTWRAMLPSVRDAAANWVECPAITAFSQWTFSSLTPTAADGTVTGRIVDGNGAPVEGAVVRLTGDQNRKFITNANGVYRFDNVETNGFYNVTPSRVNYNFSPAVISFSQLGETTEASFGATATGGDINPLDTPEYFVRQNYLDFLGREPDEAGFNFWSDQILGCGGDTDCVDRKRTHVSAAFFLSIEFQETGGLVDGLYRVSYGVRPTFAEFRPDAAAVAPGLVVGNAGWEATLANGKAAFVEAFVQRAAFQTAYAGLSNEAYVDALIANTGVSFTSAERSALVSDLGNGMTRAGVLRAIAENANVVAAKRNEAFVMMEYFGYLRREPDAGGYLFWLTKLNQFNGNFEQAEMVRSFIIDGEYRDRFPR